jgi:hypothetical protein
MWMNNKRGVLPLQETLESIVAEYTSGAALVALLFEIKLKRKRVRLTERERVRIRLAADEFLKTSNPHVFDDVVVRSRKIRLRFTDKDFQLLSDVFERAVSSTVQEVTESVARSAEPAMRRQADQEYAWFEAEYSAFRTRLLRTWKEPFQHFARFRWVAAEVGSAVFNHLSASDALDGRLSTALVLLHARAHLVSGEVESLMRAGYPDGGAARWRTLHEIAVVAAFLVEKGEETAKRYLAHHACEEGRAVRMFELHRRQLGYRTVGKKYLNALDNEISRLTQEFGKEFKEDYGWAAKVLERKRVTFADIESAVKLPFMRPFYRRASEQVHASPIGALSRSGLITQTISNPEIVLGPSL